MKVLTFSRTFPAYHPKAGEPTHFVTKIWNSLNEKEIVVPNEFVLDYFYGTKEEMVPNRFEPKHHTIRAGNRWKVGDKFSPRVWSGKPYRSPQITFAPPIEVKKVWEFDLVNRNGHAIPIINGVERTTDLLLKIAINDGLDLFDLLDWFNFPKKPVTNAQILCWNDSINY